MIDIPAIDHAYQQELLNARDTIVRAKLCSMAEAQALDHDTLFDLAIQVALQCREPK